MPDQNYTAILLLVDRSGSMEKVARPMSEALTRLLQDQSRLPGLQTVSVYQFDHELIQTHDFADPDAVQVVIEPRGGSCLFDAFGVATFDFRSDLMALPDHARPAKVHVLVVTDARDNRSEEYTLEDIRERVRAREADGWTFHFIANELDVELSAATLGPARSKRMPGECESDSIAGSQTWSSVS